MKMIMLTMQLVSVDMDSIQWGDKYRPPQFLLSLWSQPFWKKDNKKTTIVNVYTFTRNLTDEKWRRMLFGMWTLVYWILTQGNVSNMLLCTKTFYINNTWHINRKIFLTVARILKLEFHCSVFIEHSITYVQINNTYRTSVTRLELTIKLSTINRFIAWREYLKPHEFAYLMLLWL